MRYVSKYELYFLFVAQLLYNYGIMYLYYFVCNNMLKECQNNVIDFQMDSHNYKAY